MIERDAYGDLIQHKIRIADLEQLQSLASWDRMTYMPPKGAVGRGRAQAALAKLLHDLETDPVLDTLIARAKTERLGPDESANLALMEKARRRALALPDTLVQRRALLTARAGQAWTAAKADGGWNAFAPDLEPLVACVRETAHRTGDALGLSAYDALMDGYEPGARLAWVSLLFDDVADWLPPLIAKVAARQTDLDPVYEPVNPTSLASRRKACEHLMRLLGFDFAAGRLDESAHPFTAAGFDDVRITARLGDPAWLQVLLGVAHETGHARYQLGLPPAWRGQPVGEACSAAMHEAQAITFERQITPTRGILLRLSPLLIECFGADPAYGPDNLRRLITTVAPSPIRVEADALTYPVHVILRVTIEAALINGDIEVRDIPAVWMEQMRRMLGLEVDGFGAAGAIQDIHWAQGMFGYFPSYLLGALIAAQLTEAYRRERGDPDLSREADDLEGLDAWLGQKVWINGARTPAQDLIRQVTGEALNSRPLRDHFIARYLT